MTRTSSSVHPRLVVGLTLVAIGFLFLLDHLLPFRFHLGDFWPLLLVFWGIARFSSHGSRGVAFSAGLIIFGVFFLLEDYLPFSYIFDWDNLWPLAIIGLGGFLITKNITQRRTHDSVSDASSDDMHASDHLREFTFLGGRKSSISSSNFSGGSVTVALGGLEIDCRQAKLSTQTSEVIIDVTVMMAGIEITVPDDWSVVVRATPILGGIEDKRSRVQGATSQGTVLVIDGIVLMGGVEILSKPS